MTIIEAVLPSLLDQRCDAVSARALAPLDALLSYSQPLLEKGAIGVFLKGKDVASELTALEGVDRFAVSSIPSTTATDARLLLVKARRVPDSRS